MRAALIVIVSAAILLAAAGPILSSIVINKVKARLEASNIHISSLSINLFTRSVTLRDVDWSENSRKARVNRVYIGGIGILPWFRDHQISVRKLYFEGGTVSIVIDTTKRALKPDSIKFSSIDIDRIRFKDIEVAIKSDTIVEYSAKVGVDIHYMFIREPSEYRDPSAYAFRNIETTVRDLKIQKAGSLYKFTIKNLAFDKELKTLRIDSLDLEPLLNKNDYAREVKSQETRTTLRIGHVDASGVNMAVHMADTSIMATSVLIDGANIHAYKNKKYPFNRKEKFPLPMESFQSLHFGVEIDTVKIKNSTITYEELPTEGFHTAHITFENVEATMNAVNNREYKNMSGVSTIEASAHIMKTGIVKATFKLPLEASKKYTAEGTISNVPLRELNPLLKDLAFIEISSGRLDKMEFAFVYDDNGSKGQLHFDYEDLKILGLRKVREKDIDIFKTLVVNTALKNDETLTGDIDVKRNKKKAVFNLWTISIVDGIRTALVPGKKNKSNKKKGK